MRDFNYSAIREQKWDSEILGLVAAIYKEAGKQELYLKQRPEELEKLVEIAKVQSTEASNAIEGIVTNSTRIRQLVEEKTAPRNRDEQEIAGYRDALAVIHEHHGTIDFRTRDVLRLHAMLMGPSGDPLGGKFKTEDNVILEVDNDGRRRIRFRPTPAEETCDAMEQLELAYLEARMDADINQLLLIPCVILDFLCIHPFRDGNGRMSRLLSLLLLYKNGYDAGKYVSFEEQINKYKAYYYDTLKKSSDGWEDNENDYFPFMENFLSTLYMCYKELDSRFAVSHTRRVSKRERIETTVRNSLVPVSKADICKVLPDVSPTTVEAVLGEMLKKGDLRKVGQGRATRYIGL